MHSARTLSCKHTHPASTMDLPTFHSGLLLTFSAYLVGTASPGPSNLAIMGTAMSQGRPHALALAAGVMNGSLIWGLSAGFGLASLMQAYSWSLVIVKVLGGLYMLWLASKAARAAFATDAFDGATGMSVAGASLKGTYLKGLAMHLTNPKAIFVWLSIVALGLPPDAKTSDALVIVAGCALIALCVFFGYALAFSTSVARHIYRRVHRWFNAALAGVFAFAGVRMLLSR